MPLDQVRAIENALILQSMMVMLFMLATLRLSRGERPLLIASVWELLLSICFSCFLWICFLNVTMRLWMVFLSLSNGVLLAIVVHLMLGAKDGMVAVHVNTHLATGFVGYALAEHRLKTAPKYVIAMPTSNKQQEEEDKLRIPMILLGLFTGVATLGAVVAVACVVCHAAVMPRMSYYYISRCHFSECLSYGSCTWIGYYGARLLDKDGWPLFSHIMG